MTAVLIDTSIWRRYVSGRTTVAESNALGELLDEDGGVLIHPAVIGELVLGGISTKQQEYFSRLPHVAEVSSVDLLDFIRARKLAREGVGWVDAQLLASALVAGVKLWSADARLAAAAQRMGAGFAPN